MARIVSVKIKPTQEPRQWGAYFYLGRGQFRVCRLKDGQGPIIPSPGVSRIEDEDPSVAARAAAEAYRWANALGAEGAFSTSKTWKYEKAMSEYLKWHSQHRNNPKVAIHGRKSVEVMGAERITAIARQDVRTWIASMVKAGYAHNTIKHAVNAGKACYNWLETGGIWKGDNPFTGHEWKARGKGREIKQVISPEEWRLICTFATGNERLEQAVVIAYYTGLRPSEAYRVESGDFNHRDLILEVRVRKTGNYTRLIAIPRVLSEWAQAHELKPLNPVTIQHSMKALAAKHPTLTGLCMDSFRHSFGHRAEAAGIQHEWIKAHLGHSQGADVLKASYLQDRMRAVNLMRARLEFIEIGGGLNSGNLEQTLNKGKSGGAVGPALSLAKTQ